MPEPAPGDILLHRLTDGRKLAWREAGAGAPLVMLHGWSMSGAVFSEVASRLSPNFRVLCPDLRGHGWSDPGEEYHLEALAQDLIDWVQGLGLSHFSLLGWSLGGQVAMCLAGRLGPAIERLLLVSTTPRFCQERGWLHGLPAGQVRVMDRQLEKNYLKTLGEFFDLQFSGEHLSAERRRELLRFAVRSSRLPEIEDCRAALRGLSGADCRPLLTDITSPTLVLHGTGDKIIPCSAGQFLAETIPRAQLQLLEGIGHAPFMSRPDHCVEICREYLQ